MYSDFSEICWNYIKSYEWKEREKQWLLDDDNTWWTIRALECWRIVFNAFFSMTQSSLPWKAARADLHLHYFLPLPISDKGVPNLFGWTK